MEYMFVGYNYEEFKIWLHFVNDQLAEGLRLDSLRSSHPIEVGKLDFSTIYYSIFIDIFNFMGRFFLHNFALKT